jgi:predicted DsbA family dithiol-disulfide isomerase
MAVASEWVTTLTVEATEFRELARRFGVQGVPRTVVNRQGAVEGALPEPEFVAAVLRLAGVDLGEEAEPGVGPGPQSEVG